MRAPTLVAAALLASASVCGAQDAITTMGDRYAACVRAASLNDWAARGDKSMAVEQAFQACAAEEQAVMAYIAVVTNGSGPGARIALGGWAAFKLRLKQDIIARLP